jgi:hypothetical protein
VRAWKQLNAEDFWENVKPSNVTLRPKWMTFDDEWVDEVRRGLKACAVFCWFPIYCEFTRLLFTFRYFVDHSHFVKGLRITS